MVIDKSVCSFIDRNTIMTVIYHLNSQTYSLVILITIFISAVESQKWLLYLK